MEMFTDGPRHLLRRSLLLAHVALALAASGIGAQRAFASVALGPITQVLARTSPPGSSTAMSPHGQTVLFGSTRAVLMWRAAESGGLSMLDAKGGGAVRISDDGRRAAFTCGYGEQYLCFWRRGRTTGRVALAPYCPRHNFVISAGLSPDWQTLVITCELSFGVSEAVVVVKLRGLKGRVMAKLDGFQASIPVGSGTRLTLTRNSSTWTYAHGRLRELAENGWYGPSENAVYAALFGPDGEGTLYDTETRALVASGFRSWMQEAVDPACPHSAECISPGASVSNDGRRMYFNAKWGGTWPSGQPGDEGTFVADLASREAVEIDPKVFERTSDVYRHSFLAGVSASGSAVLYAVAETVRNEPSGNGAFVSYYLRTVSGPGG